MNDRCLAGAALMVLMNAGCAQHSAPAPVAPPATAATIADGSPQIVTSADGVHIEYQVYGHGDPAIVLVHGWSNNANYWNAQLDALQSKYTVVTLNLAGHGASGKNRADWSIENYGADVAAVAHEIASPRVVLVGHAMGGVVVLEAAHRMGARVIGIIGVDAFKSIGQAPMSKTQFAELMQPFRSDFIAHMHEFVGDNLFTQSADPAFVRKVTADMALASPEVAVASLEGLYRYDLAAAVAQVHVPIIAINSDLRMPTDEARIRKSAPTFRAIVVPGSGHFLMMEAPGRFNPLLLQAIDSLAKP